MSLNSIVIPNTVFEALFKREWQDAMKEEMHALKRITHGKLWTGQKEKKQKILKRHIN